MLLINKYVWSPKLGAFLWSVTWSALGCADAGSAQGHIENNCALLALFTLYRCAAEKCSMPVFLHSAVHVNAYDITELKKIVVRFVMFQWNIKKMGKQCDVVFTPSTKHSIMHSHWCEWALRKLYIFSFWRVGIIINHITAFIYLWEPGEGTSFLCNSSHAFIFCWLCRSLIPRENNYIS